MKRYIRATFMDDYKDNYAIPEPFNTWYRIASDDEIEEITGWDGHDYICEQNPGYDLKHLAWAVIKDEYWNGDFADNPSFDVVELVTEGDGKPFLAYQAGDEIYPLDITDIPRNLREEG